MNPDRVDSFRMVEVYDPMRLCPEHYEEMFEAAQQAALIQCAGHGLQVIRPPPTVWDYIGGRDAV